MTTQEIISKAVASKSAIASLTAEQKKAAIMEMSESIMQCRDDILSANAKDVEASTGALSPSMIDRLTLNNERIAGIVKSMWEIAEQADPIGKTLSQKLLPNGLKMKKIVVPMGVIAIIYESRPNVTADAATLAFKAGSCCVLRCGKEAWNSANAIVVAMQKGLQKMGLPEGVICLIEDTQRTSATELMTAKGKIDLLIPRGGAGLIQNCVQNATVPCIETGTGICHVYVSATAKLDMATDIVENAKASRPSVCNACEVCLVHEDIAEEFLPMLKARLTDERAERGLPTVQLRLCEKSAEIIDGTAAGENDFDTEFLDYILAIKVVSSDEMAVLHIAEHSTGHSESVVTESSATSDLFTCAVDSSAVYVNASTRFTDGGEFGMGGEMGISTQKLHARGPMGIEELCAYKYVIKGDGQIR